MLSRFNITCQTWHHTPDFIALTLSTSLEDESGHRARFFFEPSLRFMILDTKKATVLLIRACSLRFSQACYPVCTIRNCYAFILYSLENSFAVFLSFHLFLRFESSFVWVSSNAMELSGPLPTVMGLPTLHFVICIPCCIPSHRFWAWAYTALYLHRITCNLVFTILILDCFYQPHLTFIWQAWIGWALERLFIWQAHLPFSITDPAPYSSSHTTQHHVKSNEHQLTKLQTSSPSWRCQAYLRRNLRWYPGCFEGAALNGIAPSHLLLISIHLRQPITNLNISQILRDCVTYTEHRHAKTVTVTDVSDTYPPRHQAWQIWAEDG